VVGAGIPLSLSIYLYLSISISISIYIGLDVSHTPLDQVNPLKLEFWRGF